MTTFFRFDLSALQDQIEGIDEAIRDAARPAAQAGAQVLYDEVKRNVSRLKRHTGRLADSIYQAYSKSNSADGVAVYHISWNYRKAPHGHWLEYGFLQRYEITYDPRTRRLATHKDRPLAQPKQVAAKPFLRPAMARFDAALAAATAELFKQLDARL